MIEQFLKRTIVLIVLLPFYSCGQSGHVDGVSRAQKLYDSIAQELVSVGFEDQKYRNELDEVVRKYGGDSKELKDLFKEIDKADSINLIKVSAVIAR